MKLHPHLTQATFVRRLNRFAAEMIVDGQNVMVHIANSGRMEELLSPANRMLLTPVDPRTDRKTAFDLALVEVGGELVSADARLPNALMREAIDAGRISELTGYDEIRQEVTFEDSRFDLMLSGSPVTCYVEVKSVTLVEDGIGLFPDAPTSRGRKHVQTLLSALRQGYRGVAMFVVQRSDAHAMSPHEIADPDFCQTLRDAVSHGVEAYAYRCEVSIKSIVISDSVPVILNP